MNAGSALGSRPLQRLRLLGVLAVSGQLVRGTAARRSSAMLERLMAERRRLLRELGDGIEGAGELGCFEAMQAAVEESDRALLRMLKDEHPCTTA